MDIEFDADKNVKNIRERGLSFELAAELEWTSAVIIMDDRNDYGEIRYRVLGLIGHRVHALVFTVRGEVMRVISLRRANKREIKRYEQATKAQS